MRDSLNDMTEFKSWSWLGIWGICGFLHSTLHTKSEWDIVISNLKMIPYLLADIQMFSVEEDAYVVGLWLEQNITEKLWRRWTENTYKLQELTKYPITA